MEPPPRAYVPKTYVYPKADLEMYSSCPSSDAAFHEALKRTGDFSSNFKQCVPRLEPTPVCHVTLDEVCELVS